MAEHDYPALPVQHPDLPLPDDGYADGGEAYTDEELAIIAKELPDA